MRGGYRAFFDTNVLAYIHDEGSSQEEADCQRASCFLVPYRKDVYLQPGASGAFCGTHQEVEPSVPLDVALKELEHLNLGAKTVVVTPGIVFRAVRIHQEVSISFWNALIVSAAAHGGCRVLFTENLNPGQVIEGVRVENPFLEWAEEGAKQEGMCPLGV